MPERKRNWDKTQAAQEYRNRYTRDHYDSLTLTIPKGFRQVIADAADREGMNKSTFVVKCVMSYLESRIPDEILNNNEKGTE